MDELKKSPAEAEREARETNAMQAKAELRSAGADTGFVAESMVVSVATRYGLECPKA